MSARWTFAIGLALLSTGTACSDSEDIGKFTYGADQPGTGLPEGGEIRHENVRFLGQPVQSWVMVYQYTAAASVPTAPFAEPLEGGKGKWGNCVDERGTPPTWPFHPITGATYLDLPKVSLSGPGITGALEIVKTDPVNKVGNSTFRAYDFTYGGGGPDPTGTKPLGFNGTLSADVSQSGATYSLDIGKKDKDGKLTPITYQMPEAYTAPLGIGGAATVMIPTDKDLEYTWTTPKNDKGESGEEHTRATYFNFTFFADPTAASPPQFICFPDVDGHQVVPKAVLDELSDSGLIVNANLSHWLDARETNPGEIRRFDAVSIWCNISAYKKQ